MIEAGLPNLQGGINVFQDENGVSGLLAVSTWGNDRLQGNSSSGTYRNCIISFNASRYNSIYGGSSTVQPPALTVKYYIKF